MAEIGALEVSLSLNAASFNGSIAQVNRQMTAMGSELRALSERGDAYGRSVDGLGQKQNILSRQFEAAGVKLQEQRRRYDELVASGTASEAAIERQANAVNRAQADYNRLERQLAEVTNQLRVQSSQWTQAGQQLQEVGNKMQAIGGSLTSIGKDLSLKVTAPITALGAGAFKAAVDFESAFAGVRKTVDTSEEGFKKLEQGIRDMAKQLPASASDIAAVAESAGQLGIAEDKILSFSRTIIDLGESTNMTREQAATEFARFANIVGMSQDNFDRLGSSIVGLGNTMATTESEIMSMGMRLAAQGKQVGMSEAQIMALAGTMSSLGIQAEMGGTAMTTVLKKMQGAIMEGGASLGTWAEVAQMSSSEFKKLYDSSAIDGLDAIIKGLATISSRGENLTEVLKDMGIKGIYESDVMMRMAGASDLLSSAVATSTDAWKENTALSNEAAQRYDTTASQLSKVKNQIVDIGITLGNILIPMVLSLLAVLQPWIEKFANLSESTQKLIVIIAGIAAAIGPIIVVVGTLISSIGTIISTFGTLALAIGEAGGIVALLTAKLSFLAPVFTALTGPIGLTIAAIGAIGAALVIAYNKVDWFREGVNNIWNQIKEVTSVVFLAVKELITSMISGAVELGKDILNKFKDFWDENGKFIVSIVKLHFEQIKSNIEMVMGVIKGIFEMVWPLISNIIKVSLEFMKLTVRNGMDLILGVISAALKLLQGDWKGAWDELGKIGQKMMDNFKAFLKGINLEQIGKDIINGLIKGIGSMTNAVMDKAKSLANGITKTITSALDIHSPSRVMIAIGKNVGEGLALGIESTQARNEGAMKELGQLLIDVTKSNQSEVTKIADEAEKERTKIQQDAAKKKLEIENKLGVDLQKANNTISAKKKGATANDNIKIQQLKETANAKLVKLEQDTQDKLKKVNDKAWSDMVKKEEKAASERLKVVKQYIAEKESTDELSLATEQHILEQSLKLFKDGTAEKIEVQKMYKKVTESINKEKEAIDKTYMDNVKKLNDEYIKEEERLTKVYQDEFDKRRNAYYSFAGLFDEVAQRDVSGATLIAALQSQVTAFEDWQKNITSLASKGINEGLLAELQAMGPKAGAEIAALNTLTEEQLAEYTELWKTKNEQARLQAEEELVQLKQNTEKQINELKLKTSEQLRIYQNDWRNSMIALKGNVKTELAEMPNIGVYAVSGLIEGMMSKQGDLMNAAQSLASIVAGAFASALDIHSPSRVMRGYGVNIGEGLVLGINDMVGKVAGATKRLANAVTNGSYKSDSVGNTTSSTTNNTENIYNLTVNSPKPLDPYETARLSKNGWKEMGLQFG